jgi:hypothetical protein
MAHKAKTLRWQTSMPMALRSMTLLTLTVNPSQTILARKLGHAFKLLGWRGIEGFLTSAIKQADELKANYKSLLAALPARDDSE